MTELPLHPKLVHLPLGLAVVLPLVLLVLTFAIYRNWLPPRAWWLGVMLSALMSASAFIAMNTGDADEERVERVVAEHEIHEHETAAEYFSYIGTGVMLLVVATAFVKDRRKMLALQSLCTLLAIFTLSVAIRTGHLGGKLVYKYNAAKAYLPNTTAPADTSIMNNRFGKPGGETEKETQSEHDDD